MLDGGEEVKEGQEEGGGEIKLRPNSLFCFRLWWKMTRESYVEMIRQWW